MRRRSFLLSSLALAACAAAPKAPSASSNARRLTVTMDDPNLEETPRLAPGPRNAAILQTLAARKHRAALFVCGMRVDSPDGAALLGQWSAAGHMLGNHSYSHRYFHSEKMSVADYVAELERGESVMRGYPGFRRRFRFPFLKEGDTVEKRDGARAALVARGYGSGHVTIDASDWAFDSRLRKRLRREPAADLTPFRDAYVAHMLDRARYYDDLARAALGKRISHTMLVHHSLLNALFLDDLLEAFAKEGWALVDAEEAFSDPVFQRVPQVLPAGESLVWSIAKENPALAGRLRYPGEDDQYEKTTLDRLEPAGEGS